MATTSVNTSVPQWLTGCTYDADGGNDLRNSGVTADHWNPGSYGGTSVAPLGGVLGGGNALAVAPGSGMSVTVGSGSFVAAAAAATNGAYKATLASQATLAVAAADTVNSRIDLVCATVIDNGNNTSFGCVQIITGTPATSPVAPALPAASVPLGYVTVAANSTSVTSVADGRIYTAAVGGILPVPVASAPVGYEGAYCHDPNTHRLYRAINPAGVRQAQVLPFIPAQAGVTTSVPLFSNVSGTVTSTEVTIATVTVTTDGLTDLEITIKGAGIYQEVAQQTGVVFFRIRLDGTVLDEFFTGALAAMPLGDAYHGFCNTHFTSASLSTTPSAATHTITFTGEAQFTGAAGSTPQTYLKADTDHVGYLRVRPVTL